MARYPLRSRVARSAAAFSVTRPWRYDWLTSRTARTTKKDATVTPTITTYRCHSGRIWTSQTAAVQTALFGHDAPQQREDDEGAGSLENGRDECQDGEQRPFSEAVGPSSARVLRRVSAWARSHRGAGCRPGQVGRGSHAARPSVARRRRRSAAEPFPSLHRNDEGKNGSSSRSSARSAPRRRARRGRPRTQARCRRTAPRHPVREGVREELADAGDGEPPVLRVEVPHADPAHGRNGAEQDAARSQDAVRLAEDAADIEDELQRLDEEETVEGVGRDRGRLREVGDDRRVRVRRVDVDDVAARRRPCRTPAYSACRAPRAHARGSTRAPRRGIARYTICRPACRGRAPTDPKEDAFGAVRRSGPAADRAGNVVGRRPTPYVVGPPRLHGDPHRYGCAKRRSV